MFVISQVLSIFIASVPMVRTSYEHFTLFDKNTLFRHSTIKLQTSMPAIELTTNPDVVCLTIERASLNAATVQRINEVLLELIGTAEHNKTPQTALTASELRRLLPEERDAILTAQTQLALQDVEYLDVL
jgi:hypothetical protein